MSAEVMRRAAVLMWERAERATTSPWHTYADPTSTIVFDQYGIGVQSAGSQDVVCYSGQIYTRDAEHIASWHPAVALAVADLLDELLRSLSVFGEPPDDDPLWSKPTASSALAVAQTYLNEVTP